jgi:hypothetical protein
MWSEGVDDRCVTKDLDTFATALYVRTDDLLKAFPELAPWRPRVGFEPELTDTELVNLSVMQALLGFTSERCWLRHARKHLTNLFRYLPEQSGYNKRLRKASALLKTVIQLLSTDTTLWTDDVWVIDSTPVECGRSRETVRRSDLAGWGRIWLLRFAFPLLLLGAAPAPAVHAGRSPSRVRVWRSSPCAGWNCSTSRPR